MGETMKQINQDKIKLNLQHILATNKILWVLKDNAYGFGAEEMLSIAKEVGIFHFAVRSVEEGIYIKKYYPEAEVLVFGKIRHQIALLKKHGLIGTINDFEDYLLFKEYRIRAHLAIDVGMNRFGMKSGYLAVINDPLIEAIYIHLFRSSDVEQHIAFIEDLAKRYHKHCHIGGSIAYGRTKECLRIGEIIYEHVLRLDGSIVNIKKVQAGEGVGYDSCFSATKEQLIGVCDIGYVNGLRLFYKGKVVIRNQYYQVVGRCCMDQCFIVIDERVKIGDKVEFFGSMISEEEFCHENNMTKYELFLKIR